MPKFKLTKIPDDEVPTLKTAAAYTDIIINTETADKVADQWYLEASCRSADKAYEMGRLHQKLIDSSNKKSE